jgi:hypothetical protein
LNQVKRSAKHHATFGHSEVRDRAYAAQFIVSFNKEELRKQLETSPEPTRSYLVPFLGNYRDDQEWVTLFLFKYNKEAYSSVVVSDLRWRNLRPANWLDLTLLPSWDHHLARRIVVAPAEGVSVGKHPAMSFKGGKPQVELVDTITNQANRKAFCYLALYCDEPKVLQI